MNCNATTVRLEKAVERCSNSLFERRLDIATNATLDLIPGLAKMSPIRTSICEDPRTSEVGEWDAASACVALNRKPRRCQFSGRVVHLPPCDSSRLHWGMVAWLSIRLYRGWWASRVVNPVSPHVAVDIRHAELAKPILDYSVSPLSIVSPLLSMTVSAPWIFLSPPQGARRTIPPSLHPAPKSSDALLLLLFFCFSFSEWECPPLPSLDWTLFGCANNSLGFHWLKPIQ